MSIMSTSGSGLSPEQMREAIATLSSPDVVESPFGQLDFFDGVPRPDTVTKVYDALDLMRGIEVFLNAVPGASLVAMRRGLRAAGVTSARVIGHRATRELQTACPDSEYGNHLRHHVPGPQGVGPDRMVEAPPESLCVVDDFWFRYVADMAASTGPDRGQGGKYLFAPPRVQNRRPAGRVLHLPLPDVLQLGVLRALGGVPAMKQTRIYPLSQAAPPEDNEFINLADAIMNTVHGNDFSFFEVTSCDQGGADRSARAERAASRRSSAWSTANRSHPTTGCAASSPRPPRSAPGWHAVAYEPRDPEAALYGSWKNAFVGGSHEFLRNGARLLDARTQSTTWPRS